MSYRQTQLVPIATQTSAATIVASKVTSYRNVTNELLKNTMPSMPTAIVIRNLDVVEGEVIMVIVIVEEGDGLDGLE